MTETTEFNFEAEMEIRRRLLRHLIANWNDDLVRTATDGFEELLSDAHEEMLENLLSPLIEWSDFWPNRMAAEILNLSLDDEYDCRELLDRFEGQEQQADSNTDSSKSNWRDEGF
ncbi:hypothetical protein LOC67_20270 [Stieleria sp. JC731]|uniref:hypothetical protein n=1 Tax=Pirellulaceae TaxID=2691357 RepID=UPI001E56E671|nr:hypothetical protein [Stieleria sp. JC731]MCC9602892.1 hypothetical protein [Stieleria sp. JC731]